MYKPYGFNGGYQEEKLVDGAYRVSVVGNAYTSAGIVHRYLLRRCAELAGQQGFAFFTISQESRRVTVDSLGADAERAEAEQQLADGYAGDRGGRMVGANIIAQPTELDRHTDSCVMRGYAKDATPEGAFEVAAVLAAAIAL